ncbi:MAG: hypothetical protein J0L93_06820 [Deltaproteobacteria bacterium]|nr:hypothetical protein [Deltaproteobacteria bacterium]
MTNHWDHLFEWHLSMQLSKHAVLRSSSISRKKKRKSAPSTTDLGALHLLYNGRAELNLGDVKPSGFLVKAKG